MPNRPIVFPSSCLALQSKSTPTAKRVGDPLLRLALLPLCIHVYSRRRQATACAASNVTSTSEKDNFDILREGLALRLVCNPLVSVINLQGHTFCAIKTAVGAAGRGPTESHSAMMANADDIAGMSVSLVDSRSPGCTPANARIAML